MADNRPIGLFDSGVGGLSILVEIKKKLPRESFVFFADQLNNPYGEKTKKELELLASKITDFLIEKKIKLLVVACNTASCYTLDYLRARYSLPIVGVVPAIKPAVHLSKSSRIAIISTRATAKSKYLTDLIKEHAQGSLVLRLGCEGLGEAVEKLDKKKIKNLIDKYSRQVKKFDADVIVLGCTHYPFLKEKISEKFARGIKIIDSGVGIASRVKEMLVANNTRASKKSIDTYYTTSQPKDFSRVSTTLLKFKIEAQAAKI